MADPVKPNAPAPAAKPDEKPVVPAQSQQPATDAKPPVVEAKPLPTGLDAFTTEQLKDFYKRSPQMFEEAGIVAKKEEAPPKKEEPPVVQPKVETPPPVSAAPKYGDVEIKLPTDVPVNNEMVEAYLAHAKEVGLNANQVQMQIDFQVKQARAALAAQPKQPTLAEIDAANVALLKADPAFGKDFDKNMEVARRAAAKFGDAELIKRLSTSDPVLVKHLWKIGQADGEDSTPSKGAARTGVEGEPDPEATQDEYYQKRYSNSPTMFKPALRG